ncbi:MAG: hypothetical protein JST82_16860 [Bacteroidetes bacterium]|nr:hypothetical protein [Bacteroidota bacterium]
MRYLLSCLLFCLSVGVVSAQEVYNSSNGRATNENAKKKTPHGFETSRIIFGGGFGFGFGTVTNVSVIPVIGYRFSDRFSAGLEFGYQYLRVKDYWPVNEVSNGNSTTTYKPFTSNVYTTGAWARYLVWNNIFAQIGYEHNFLNFKSYKEYYTGPIIPEDVNYNVPSILIGAGIRQPISERVSLMVMGRYDILQQKYSPYRGTLDIRFGIVAGF